MNRPRFALLCCLALASPLAADDLAPLDEKVLTESKVGTDTASLRTFFRKRTPTAEDQRRIAALVALLGDRVYSVRNRATEELVSQGPAALDSLRRARKNADIEVVRRAERCIEEIERPGSGLSIAAIRQLARKKPTDAIAILLAYAPHADDEIVTEALLAALTAVSDTRVPNELLLRALRDTSPARRLAAAHVLGRHVHKSAREATIPLLKDPEVLVRFRAAQALLHGKEKAAVVALIDLLGTAPPEVRWQVEDLLARVGTCLMGEPGLPPAPTGDSPEQRRHWRDAWTSWWSKHERAIDLARLEDRPPFQNLTVVPEMHAHKIWEFGPDGKVRWEITRELRCPIDAQVLQGGRVLVAELEGHRVTERDRDGKILWQHNVNTPIYCRRMPSGNTFIATNHSCFIVTAAGKEVFRYNSEQAFFIHSVQQMPAGQIVCISMDGDVREIAPDGKVTRTLALTERGGWSGIEGLPGNRYLCVGNGRLREIDATGKVLWKLDRPSACFATRLPSGNTLIVDNSRGLAEVNRDGKVVWERGMTTSLWRAHRR